MPDPTRILVIGPAWVGDMVMAQSLFMMLKAREPGAVIDVVGPAWSVPLVARMPEVRRGIALNAGHGELALPGRRSSVSKPVRTGTRANHGTSADLNERGRTIARR